MAFIPIIITTRNASWAINENWRRIYTEIGYKLPIRGFSQLLGDLDFESAYTVKGVAPIGATRSAISLQPYSANPELL